MTKIKACFIGERWHFLNPFFFGVTAAAARHMKRDAIKSNLATLFPPPKPH